MKKRFYPNSTPEFPNEPTHDKFSIGLISPTIGEGVISKNFFKKGEIVFAFTGFLLNEITQFTLQYDKGLHIHDPYFMGKILHSCAPNTVCDMKKRVFVAKTDIIPGDLITMDYEQTEEVLFKPFPCSCGSSKCKGMIYGYKARAKLVNNVA